MALAADEERALSQIEEELRRSDPTLAAKLAMFNRLTRSEAMPQRELLTTPSRLRRFSSRAGMWVAHWRLYPPTSSQGQRFAAPPGPATRFGPATRPGPATWPGPAARPHPGGLSRSGRHPNARPRLGGLPGLSRQPGGTAQYRWPSRMAAILPVIVTVCALGAIVAIFSALGNVGSPATRPAPASPCRSVLLAGCQSAAHHAPPKR